MCPRGRDTGSERLTRSFAALRVPPTRFAAFPDARLGAAMHELIVHVYGTEAAGCEIW